MTNRRGWGLAVSFAGVWLLFEAINRGFRVDHMEVVFLPPLPAYLPFTPQTYHALPAFAITAFVVLLAGRQLLRGEVGAAAVGPWAMFVLRIAGAVLIAFAVGRQAATLAFGHEYLITVHSAQGSGEPGGEDKTGGAHEEARWTHTTELDPYERADVLWRGSLFTLLGLALIRFPHVFLGGRRCVDGSPAPDEPITSHQLIQWVLRLFGVAALAGAAAALAAIAWSALQDDLVISLSAPRPLAVLMLAHVLVAALAAWFPRTWLRKICGEDKPLSALPAQPSITWYAAALMVAAAVDLVRNVPGTLQRTIYYFVDAEAAAPMAPPLPWLLYYLAIGLAIIILAKPIARLIAPDAPDA